MPSEPGRPPLHRRDPDPEMAAVLHRIDENLDRLLALRERIDRNAEAITRLRRICGFLARSTAFLASLLGRGTGWWLGDTSASCASGSEEAVHGCPCTTPGDDQQEPSRRDNSTNCRAAGDPPQ